MGRVAVLAALCAVVVTGCEDDDTECPEGAEPIVREWFGCDETTRICKFYQSSSCPCEDCPPVRPERGGPSDCEGLPGVAEYVSQMPLPNQHVVDGRFGEGEWDGAEELEGLFTNVFLDFRDGRLYVLNDWRRNHEGIRPDCFNLFTLRVGLDFIDMRVFGDGHVEVLRNGEAVDLGAEGAYGFHSSADDAEPHSIYEFSLPVSVRDIDICCFDPISESTCEELAHEPIVVSIRPGSGDGIRVGRQVPDDVPSLGDGDACGHGEGICGPGLHCESWACVNASPVLPDAGPDAGGVDADPPS